MSRLTQVFASAALGLLILGAGAQAADATSLANAVADTKSGVVECTYVSRPGVYGNGRWIVTPDHNWHMNVSSRSSYHEGPVQLTLRVRDGQVVDLDTTIGGEASRGATQVGMVSTAEVEAFLMNLAASAKEDVAENALFAVTLTDDPQMWDRVLAFTKDPTVPLRHRAKALFWLATCDAPEVTAYFEQLILD